MHKSFSTICAIAFTMAVHAQSQFARMNLNDDNLPLYDEVQENKHIYEGSIVEVNRKSKVNHQFYENHTWYAGEITFDGQSYKRIRMLYDLEADLLYVKNAAAVAYYQPGIRINQERIERFTLFDEEFRYLKENTPNGPGIYHIMYEGDAVSMHVKRTKSYKIEADLNLSRGVVFYSNDRYYILHDGQYTLLRGKGTFFKLFKDRKTELKKFIKSRHLKIGEDNDAQLKMVVDYCNKLLIGQ